MHPGLIKMVLRNYIITPWSNIHMDEIQSISSSHIYHLNMNFIYDIWTCNNVLLKLWILYCTGPTAVAMANGRDHIGEVVKRLVTMGFPKVAWLNSIRFSNHHSMMWLNVSSHSQSRSLETWSNGFKCDSALTPQAFIFIVILIAFADNLPHFQEAPWSVSTHACHYMITPFMKHTCHFLNIITNSFQSWLIPVSFFEYYNKFISIMTYPGVTCMKPHGWATPQNVCFSMQDLVFLEFFAGQGNTWKAMRADSMTAVGVDITYWEKCDDHQNPFDILSSAGFALPGLILNQTIAFLFLWVTCAMLYIKMLYI